MCLICLPEGENNRKDRVNWTCSVHYAMIHGNRILFLMDANDVVDWMK